jgi:hypothetical protein
MADLLAFLHERGIIPADYIGLEAVDTLAHAAAQRQLPCCTIIQGDFVAEPVRLFVGADVVLFSGSLNTLDTMSFYRTLRTAFDAAGEALLFNFLSSPDTAAADYLHWHRPDEVLSLVRGLTPHICMLEDYLHGDCTIALRKPTEAA